MNFANQQKVRLQSFYTNKKVLITGHTGFKGTWLAILLQNLGASIVGFSLAPLCKPNLYEVLNLDKNINSILGDIRNLADVQQVMIEHKPEIVFHLAAQSLVRPSYEDPINTFNTNVLGTAHVLEACRQSESVRSIIVITSDKCYLNNEWLWGYRENDSLGGKDPYSSSKACAELVAMSYHHAFFNNHSNIKLATARGGNVVGGGDWAEDRLIPDMVRSIQQNKSLVLRNPNATRPWQHVLELAYGYSLLAYWLEQDRQKFQGAWNFGPGSSNDVSVKTLVDKFLNLWDVDVKINVIPEALQEASMLKLDSSKAKAILGWSTLLDIDAMLALTTKWYKSFYEKPGSAANLIIEQINDYWNLVG